MKVKDESKNAGLKLNIHKMKIMASHLITSWQIHGKNFETVTDFIFLGSKIIVDSDCSHKTKSLFLIGRKAITNLDSILKSRDIALPTKVHIVKAMVFPLVMYRYENWAGKKTEHWKIDAFKLVLEKTLESLGLQGDQTSQSYRKSTVNIYWKDWCWSWSSSTLATWCEEPTHKKWPWCWERLRAREGGDKG